jgi:hypothetical protein
MARITEIGRDETKAYGVTYVVCGNAEVLRLGLDAQDDDAAILAARRACEAIADAGYDYRRESSFAAYNGGPRTGLIEAIYHVADIEIEAYADGDTEEVLGAWRATWQRGAGATPIPADLVAKADAVETAAWSAMRAELAAAK